MESEWREVAIGELAEIFDGPHATPTKTNDGPIFLGISNLAQGRVDLTIAEHLSEEDYVRWTKRVEPEAGDVVFSYETRLGEAASIPSGLRCCLGRRMGLLRAHPSKVHKRFLLYAFLGPQFQETLRSRTIHGSTVDRIPLIDMARFPIEVPTSIDEQRAIAHILGTLDDKIELNRRMNETLEAMARTIFKSWFVDFDPVRAKAEGRDPGLPKHIANLFPDRFEGSELGENPAGWEIRSLYDCAEYINGSAFRNEHFSLDRSGLPVIKITELKDGVTEQTKFTDATLDTKYRIASGDILFSWSGSPDTSIDTFIWVGTNGWLNQHIFKISFKRPEDKYFVYYLLRHLKPEFIEIARNKQTTGLGHVTAQDLKRLHTVFPSDGALREFNLQAEPLFQKVYGNHWESRQLTALRDVLLPKLVSGDLRVRTGLPLERSAR